MGKRWRGHLPAALGCEVAFLEVQDFEGFEARAPYLRRLAWLRASLRGRRAAKTAIAAGSDTILLCTNADAGLLPMRHGVRYLIYGDATQRQLDALYYGDPRDSARKRWTRGRIGKLATRGDVFLCMSNWYREGAMEDYGARADQAIMLPPLLDTDLWAPAQRSYGRPLRALFVGGDFYRKGGDIVMALSRMIAPSEMEWHLVTKATLAHDSGPNVMFHHGLAPDSAELLELARTCHFMVLPTRADCSPNAILEASAAGLPVVATDVGGIADMIEHGVTGSLVPRAEIDCFHVAISDLIEDGDLQKMGDRARAKTIQANSIKSHTAILRRAIFRV